MGIKIGGADLKENANVAFALTGIRGIGLSTAKKICIALSIDPEAKIKLKDLDEDLLRKLSSYITQNFDEVIGSNLQRTNQERINSIIATGSYRGLRLRKRLPCRGQRTSSNARTCRGKSVASASKVVKKKVSK